MDDSDRWQCTPVRAFRLPASLGCLFLVLMLFGAACGWPAIGGAPAEGESTQWWGSRTGYPKPQLHEPRPSTDPAVREAVRQVDAKAGELSGSTVAVAVLDRETGEVIGGEHADERFGTASLSKLLVAVDVARRHTEGMPVADADVDLIRRALSISDDAAMNALWDRFDGAGAISRLAVRYGLTRTRPPEVPGNWGGTETSARDVATVLAQIPTLPAAERDLLLGPLDAAPRTAAEGFDQGYGLKDSTRPVAVKAGWMCCDDGRRTVHSAGLIGPDRRYAVALLSTQPTSKSYSEASEVVTEAAEPLLDNLG
ncbi:serine hydrolase [Saccharopolyspora gloriosae]|uniref:serine hydrolase n=1 Tax=Saccharopolyspora gloriosae TaxID=455344 RepID=UPI001FB7F122|nr:serine hydrolase [Saccharopolyspora gloriosae]